MMHRRTVLFNTHVSAQANMMPCAGWEMPMDYGTPRQEQRALREGAGIFDVSHMTMVELEGLDTPAYLLELLAHDLRAIPQPGTALHSRLLNQRGDVLDHLVIYFLSKHRYRMVFNASTRDIVCASLVEHMAKKNITITLRDDDAMLAIQGPKSLDCLSLCLTSSQADALRSLKPGKTLAAQDVFIARTPYAGEDGFDIMLSATKAVDFWHRALAAGAVPCGLGVRDATSLNPSFKLNKEQCYE